MGHVRGKWGSRAWGTAVKKLVGGYTDLVAVLSVVEAGFEHSGGVQLLLEEVWIVGKADGMVYREPGGIFGVHLWEANAFGWDQGFIGRTYRRSPIPSSAFEPN